ncbi:hypothetical protein ScPMuIL_011183 [Solemya velum]
MEESKQNSECQKITNDHENDRFYEAAKKYWDAVTPNVNGMLGGFAQISPTDIDGSKAFLRPFLTISGGKTKNHRALDCGSGIGRITKRLLLSMFQKVDMVDQCQSFIDQAKTYVGAESSRVENFFCCGLQNFVPKTSHYDIIWCQWVLGHLTDDDLILFFKRCKNGLTSNGLIIVKENTTSSPKTEFDENDSSFTRKQDQLKDLMKKSGLTIVAEQKQKGLPKSLLDVYMFALQ